MVIVTDKEFLGGRYGFIVLPMWGRTDVEAKITANGSGTASIGGISRSFTASTSADFEDDKTGLADLFVQPLWLGWADKHYDAGLSWSAYIPTGAYDESDIANVVMVQ